MTTPRRVLAAALCWSIAAAAPGLAPYQAAAQVRVIGAAAESGAPAASWQRTLAGSVPSAPLAPALPSAAALAAPPSPLAAAPAAVSSPLPAEAAARALSAAPDGEASASEGEPGAPPASDPRAGLASAGERLAALEAAEKAGVLETLFTGARRTFGWTRDRSSSNRSLAPLSAAAPAPAGSAAVVPPAPAVPAPRPGDDDWVDWAAIKWMMVQRNLSIPLFILTSIAYPAVVLPAVGPVTFGVLMALGPLAAIALGPLNGLIANRLPPREGLAALAVLRAALASALPVLSLFGAVSFWPLLLASVATGWQFSLLMTSENAYFRKFVGKSQIGNVMTLGFIGYFALQVAMGSLLGAGAWIDAWAPMTPFWISAAGHLGLAALIWLQAPRSAAESAAAVAQAVVPLAARLRRLAEAAGAFVARYWKEAALLAASVAVYGLGLPIALPLIGTGAGSPLWMAGALIYWISRTDLFQAVWDQRPVRAAILLSALAAGLIYPFQNLALPLVAAALGSKALFYGQLLGALFYGQLLSNAGMAKGLPQVAGRSLEHWIRGAVVAMGGAWSYLSLFPGSFLAAAAVAAAAALLILASSRLTHRGWIRFLGVGLAGTAGVAASWGFYPGIFASVMLLGLFAGPFMSAINAYISKASKPEAVASNFGVSGSLLNAATSLGYGLMTMNVQVQGTLSSGAALAPIVAVFLLAGAAFFLAPRWLPGLPEKSFGSDEPKKV